MKQILAVLFILIGSLASAQCAMCRAVLESQENQGLAQGINDGITWLMIFPYILVGGVAYMIYRTRNKA